MELRQIEYFLAVVKHNNYTRAASALFVSQPTLSVAIQKLEAELGLRLLERDNKGLAMTPAGEIFKNYAEKLLNDVNDLLTVMRDLNPVLKKQIKIGFPSTVGSWLWKELLIKFRSLHTDIELNVQVLGTLEIVRQLKSMDLEIGYGVIDLIDDSGIESEEIRSGQLKLIMPAGHVLANNDSVALSALADERIIMYNRNTTFTEMLFREELAKAAIEPDLYYVREQSSVFDIVAQGCGIAPVLNDKISAIRDNPNIISKPFSAPIKFKAGMLWNKNAFLSESARAFQAFIRSYKENPDKNSA